VNKILHAITTTKHPWISVVRDLSSRWMIDHPAEILETFETEVIMAKVKRAICGPQTWSKRQKSPPTISRRVGLPAMMHRHLYSEFLPGGRHVLVYSWYADGDLPATRLTCWDVHFSRRVWERSQRGYVTSVSFDFREPWGGVMSLLHQSVFLDFNLKGHFIDFLSLDTGNITTSP
jgi:hypothetical protein